MIQKYYKLARPEGWDFYTGETINYRENIGKTVSIPDKGNYELCSGSVIHASIKPNDCFIGAEIPCSAYQVSGRPVIESSEKCGFIKLKVIKEITELDDLFGWRYNEVLNPLNPQKIRAKKVNEKDLMLLEKWGSIWDSVGDSVWDSVGDSVWDSVWDSVRGSVWGSVGGSVWDSVRGSVRGSVGAYIGTLFPSIEKWKYIKHKKGEYPFQPSVDLWQRGFVPSFDGQLWRLHTGKEAKIVGVIMVM